MIAVLTILFTDRTGPNIVYGWTYLSRTDFLLLQVQVYLTMTVFEVNIQKSSKPGKNNDKKEKKPKFPILHFFFWGGGRNNVSPFQTALWIRYWTQKMIYRLTQLEKRRRLFKV